MTPYLIGIAGRSASGKTSILRELRNTFAKEEVCIISQDDYYKPIQYQKPDENGVVNYDLPGAVNEDSFYEDILSLSKGETVEFDEYVFNQPDKTPNKIVLNPAPVVIIEGLFIYHFNKINPLINLKIFIDAKEDLALQRRLLRDAEERSVDEGMVLYQWHNHVVPAFDNFLLPYRDEADVIITNNASYKKGLEVLSHHIKNILFAS